MAQDLALPHRPGRLLAGAGVAAVIAGLVAMVLWQIVAASSGASAGGPSIDLPHLLRMTSIQAGLTTVLSLLVGTALAWSLNRLRFPGRGLVVALFASAIVTPGVIVAFGLLSVWGRNGWINSAAEAMFGIGFDLPIFGLPGILAAHVILDGAFAGRILLARLDALPAARLKIGRSLGLSAWQRFAIIDWPILRSSMPGLASIIFLLAFTSFPIVLLLGGGPANQTLEVAIYSAVRLDFDLQGAVLLALTQIGVCALIVVISSALAPVPLNPGPSTEQSWRDGIATRFMQWAIVAFCLLGFLLPLLAVLGGLLSPDLPTILQRQSLWWAVLASLSIGAVSALLTLLLAMAVAMARATTARQSLRTLINIPSYAYLAVPAVVLALGFFLLVRAIGVAPDRAAPLVVIVANALLSLPFALAALSPRLDSLARGKGKLIRSLGLSGWRQFTEAELPTIGRDIGVVLALAFCFSLGDLGVIALFGTQNFATLPLLVVRALGSYRNDEAAVVSALLLVFTVAAFVLLPKAVEKLLDAKA